MLERACYPFKTQHLPLANLNAGFEIGSHFDTVVVA